MRSMCSCFGRGEYDTLSVIDMCHCSLLEVPHDIFNHDKTLEELYLDANQLKDLPRQLFSIQNLRILGLSDNELTVLPSLIGNLSNLQEIDISKNGVLDLPENVRGCRGLKHFDGSVNPLNKLPEGFTQLVNLTELYLNDCFLDFLPESFGRLNKLTILELRENHLKGLPKSMAHLSVLERLDIGSNDFSELPSVVGCLVSLRELWVDNNQISQLPPEIGLLWRLLFLDLSKNSLERLPPETEALQCLTDIYLSNNLLLELPENLGALGNLQTLKADENHISHLPESIGRLINLQELIVTSNELETLPRSVGLLKKLRIINADENFITSIPTELGSCTSLAILSLRQNNLVTIPEDIGRLPNLLVLNLSSNFLEYLPYTFRKLTSLKALWLSENQSKPMVPLQSEFLQNKQMHVLTCFMFPQQVVHQEEVKLQQQLQQQHHPSEENIADVDLLQPGHRTSIMFDVDEEAEHGHGLVRHPTPYPKDVRDRILQARLRMALKQGSFSSGEGDHHGSKPSSGKVSPELERNMVTKDAHAHSRELTQPSTVPEPSKFVNSQVDGAVTKEKLNQNDLTKYNHGPVTELQKDLPTALSMKEHIQNEILGLVPENYSDSIPDSIISLPSYCDLALDSQRHASASYSESAVPLSPALTSPSTPPLYRPPPSYTDSQQRQKNLSSKTNGKDKPNTPVNSYGQHYNGEKSRQEPSKSSQSQQENIFSFNEEEPSSRSSLQFKGHSLNGSTDYSMPINETILEELHSFNSEQPSSVLTTNLPPGYKPNHSETSSTYSKPPFGNAPMPLPPNHLDIMDSSLDTVNTPPSIPPKVSDFDTTGTSTTSSQPPSIPPLPHNKVLESLRQQRQAESDPSLNRVGLKSGNAQNGSRTSLPGVLDKPSWNGVPENAAGSKHEWETRMKPESEMRSSRLSVSSTDSRSSSSNPPKYTDLRILKKDSTLSPSFEELEFEEEEELIRVEVHKNPGLGFSIVGGLGSTNPFNPRVPGVYITKVLPDGPAAFALKSGDRVIEVNGLSLLKATHEQAVILMKNNQAVDLLIARKHPLE